MCGATLELQHTFRGVTLQGARAEEQQISQLVIDSQAMSIHLLRLIIR